MMRQYPARVPYSKCVSMHGSGTPRISSITSYTASLRSSPADTASSAPSSTLTTNDTATRAPPGQRGSGGRSP